MEVIQSGSDNIIERALQRVEIEVAELFKQYNTVIMESTAAHIDFPALVANYKQLFCHVLLIRIRVPLDTCVERCNTRDQTNQIPVSHASLLTYYEETENVHMPWDLEIMNDGTELNKNDILARCAELL
jgi:hypothetical protein